MNKPVRLLLVPALLLVAALGLAACGGSGEDSEAEAISSAIDESVTATDPAKCTEVMTQGFLEQSSSESGEAALEECEEDAGDKSDDPDKLTVSAVRIDGTEATAEVTFVGGNFDGQTVAVALIEDGGQWKLNEITGFASYDAGALAKTLEARFKSASSEITSAQIACIGDLVREASKQKAEELLLSGDSAKFVEFVQACE